MYHLLEFLHSEHDEDFLDVKLQLRQYLMVVAPPLNIYTVYTVLFYKDGGENVAVKNCISQFSMFLPTKSTWILAIGNTGHAQGIGVISCHFTNCLIIYEVVPVYYCQGQPSNTRSSGDLKLYIGCKKVTSEGGGA